MTCVAHLSIPSFFGCTLRNLSLRSKGNKAGAVDRRKSRRQARPSPTRLPQTTSRARATAASRLLRRDEVRGVA